MKYISFPGLGIQEFGINSVAFSVFGKDIAWYGIIITIGIIVGYFYSDYRASKTEKLGKDILYDYALAGVIFGVIGARIWYVATKFEAFKGDTFLETVKNCVSIWNGGLGFYGGLILGVISVVVIALIKKHNVLQMTDVLAPGVMIAQIFGRWGNFANGEAHGGVTDIFCRMGLRLPSESEATYYHPTFFYESLWNLIGFIIINFTYKNKKYNGQIFLRYITWYGFGRFFIEGLRTDSLYIGSFRISQLFGAICFLIGSALLISFDVIYYLREKDKKLVAISESGKSNEEFASTDEASSEEVIQEKTEATVDLAGELNAIDEIETVNNIEGTNEEANLSDIYENSSSEDDD